MKITDKQQEKSKVYLEAVKKMLDHKDELHQSKIDMETKAETIRAEMTEVAEQILRSSDATESKILRRKRRELKLDLEDTQGAVNVDIYAAIKLMHADMLLLKKAAMDEYNEQDEIARAEIEAIEQKAKADIKAVRETLESHIFRKANSITQTLVYQNGWSVPGWRGGL